MSKITLVSPASGTAEFSITTPSGTSTDRTLTLPDNSGTLLSNASTAGFPAGSVLQVVQNTYSTFTSTTSATYVDTGLTASITPSSASSKILVLTFQFGRVFDLVGTPEGTVRIVRGATKLLEASYGAVQAGDTGTPVYFTQVNFSYLDSPATTSSVTYKTQFAVVSALEFNINGIGGTGYTSSIILMEIAA